MFQHSDPTSPAAMMDSSPTGQSCALPFYSFKATPLYIGGSSAASGDDSLRSSMLKRSLTPPNLRMPLPLTTLSRGHSPPRHPIYARLRREEALLRTDATEATFTQRVADEDMLCRMLALSLPSSDSLNLESIGNRRSFLRSQSFGIIRSVPQRKAPSVALHSSPVAPRLPKPSFGHPNSPHGLSSASCAASSSSSGSPTGSQARTPRYIASSNANSAAAVAGMQVTLGNPNVEPPSSSSSSDSSSSSVLGQTPSSSSSASSTASSSTSSSEISNMTNADSNTVNYPVPLTVPPRSSSAPPMPCDDMT